ncbi:hypothetical protein OHA37_35400 [Streptomyces sp. NBC_00335]|uniref:hypothetical protein n=1 Tax=unclassified Streptomyces TaxID=2593676 RepID=UPI002255CCCE|nr:MULTISPECIES: hypothetical protein [unclassified Streptomyces]MCX5409127.1 hypothetical protein [Streptomyces sp. NBC_00086]
MPLIIVALAVAAGCVTGCVTVAPATGPGTVPVTGARPAPTGLRTGLPGPATEAWPLGSLPQVVQDTDPVPEEPPIALPGAAVAPRPAAPAAPAARARSRVKPAAPRHRPERPRRAAPKKPAAPAAKARRSKPAPIRSYDMAPLCAAARGTVDPAIVALCH